MTRHHVRKKTYDQCKWLGEYTQNFNQYQNRFDTTGYGRIKNMTPVMFVGTEQDHYK